MEKEIAKTIDNLIFKYVKPEDIANSNIIYRFNKYIFYLSSLLKYKEFRNFTFFQNTKTNIQKDKFKEFSKKMYLIEGMSTIANGWIINQITSNLNENQNYVNIGTWKGFSLIAGMINTICSVYGCDNFPIRPAELKLAPWKEKGKKEFYKNFNRYREKNKHFFSEQDYTKFLYDWDKKKKYIDFYFYDGPHSFEDQYRALELGSNYFKSGTIILVDDTNWEVPREATLQFINKSRYNYKLLCDLKCNHARHPTFWNGLMIFKQL